MKLHSTVQASCDYEVAKEFYQLSDQLLDKGKNRGEFVRQLLIAYKEKKAKEKKGGELT
jgi:hypothetical protein